MSFHLVIWTPLDRAWYLVLLAEQRDLRLQKRLLELVGIRAGTEIHEALMVAVLARSEDRRLNTEASRVVVERSLQALADLIQQRIEET